MSKKKNHHDEKIALNIEKFAENHIGDKATGRQQNMAARRDSWYPLINNSNRNRQNLS